MKMRIFPGKAFSLLDRNRMLYPTNVLKFYIRYNL